MLVDTRRVCRRLRCGGRIALIIAACLAFLSARSRGHVVVCVLAALMAVPVMARAGSAAADDRPPPDVTCGATGICPPPPLLGSLDRGLTRATPEQVKSLRKLEDDAVADVIRLHGLSASDTNAVLTWGRSEAQSQLFTRLLNAIDEDDRSDDQQNAVDWMTAMMQRKAVAAAAAAGREYVTWAGLNQGRFEQLLNAERQ